MSTKKKRATRYVKTDRLPVSGMIDFRIPFFTELQSVIREYLKLTETWQHEPNQARLRERIVELIQ